ncbi:MAG: PAS domain-containing protein [Clostridia bacterium]|nr:PAS domain-containing protein [Clostridia bacterium]
MKKKIYFFIVLTAFIAFLFAFIPMLTLTVFNVSETVSIIIAAASLLLAIIAVPLLANAFSKKIVKPIDELDLESPRIDKSYFEIDNLIRKIGRQNRLIDQQMIDLRRRQVEFNAITENMAEGIVILDNKSEILSYNSAALRILGSENVKEGEHFISLSRSRRFVAAVNDAFEGNHGEVNITLGSQVYQIFANPVMIENQVNGAVIVMLDITEKEKREEMRREFTSNVSHELKTPLTTISGISEMFMSGMIAVADIPKFAKNIHDESTRLLNLINDIIKLSRLDEANIPDSKEEVNLADLAEETRQRLSIAAAERDIEITVAAKPVTVLGNRSVLSEMIYNLTDNAIKYNKEGGKVKIEIVLQEGKKLIRVSDTGIGIPPEYTGRIFERFYRVDKSHSREVGGTGLGLSIVKHAAEYHGATLNVESIVDKGTVISVIFKD